MFAIKKRLKGGSGEKWGKSRECKRGPPPWPSLCSQDGWILTKFFLCIFCEQSTSIKLQKRTRSMSNHLERTSLVTKVFIKWFRGTFFSRELSENSYVGKVGLSCSLVTKDLLYHMFHQACTQNQPYHKGTQRLISEKYVFGEADIARNFLLLKDG